jgi:RNA ligase (TIGR02306 family)
MKIATIETIKSVRKHPNADSLDICSVLGFECITKIGQFKEGDVVAFLQPDSVLPPDKEWSAFYRSKSNRIKAIRLRSCWSEGVAESLATVGYTGQIEIGREISQDIGVTHYEPPLPQDLSAKGLLPFGIPPTDEERVNNLEAIPYGEIVDVTLKIDGQSWSAYNAMARDSDGNFMPPVSGVCGRRLEYKLDCDNHYTRNFKKYAHIFGKNHNLVNVCFRAEQYGFGIQSSANNPHSKLPVDLAFYSVWMMNDRRYARKGESFYAYDFFPKFGIPTAPVIERDVVLTPELVAKYADGKEINGQSYEGVVIQWSGGSFKVLSKEYDSKK